MRTLSTPFLLFFLAASCAVLAQTTGAIRGTVVDDDGKPVAGATVRIIGTTRGAITKADGSFQVAGVPVGHYEITATSVSYAPFTSSLTVEAGDTEEIHATLSPRPIRYEHPFICFLWTPPHHVGCVRGLRFIDGQLVTTVARGSCTVD